MSPTCAANVSPSYARRARNILKNALRCKLTRTVVRAGADHSARLYTLCHCFEPTAALLFPPHLEGFIRGFFRSQRRHIVGCGVRLIRVLHGKSLSNLLN